MTYKFNSKVKILMLVFTFILAVAGMVIASTTLARQEPEVEYSADSYMETADAVMAGPANFAPGKERREYIMDGMQMVMITHRDKKISWSLMPENKTYMEMKMTEEGSKNDLSNYKVEQTTVGPETVNGVKTTKSKIIMTNLKTGEKLGGFMWVSNEGIVVKMDAISVDKNSKTRIKSELKNLKIGKQDASAFEIPDDYTKMDMGMGGIGAMMGGGDDDGGDDGQAEQKQPQEKGKKGFGLDDFKKAINPFKK